MRLIQLAFLIGIGFQCSLMSIEIKDEMHREEKTPVIYLQPNTTQLFTELYEAYGFLNLPKRTFFESALYLDQSIPPNILPMQLSNQMIFNHGSEVLSEFHKRANDLELYIDPNQPQSFFYTASGSKHLIVALVYAIAMTQPNQKFVFAEQSPFYSGHVNAVEGLFHYPNARFVSFHDVSDIVLEPDELLVEIVTSPNNPDGKFRKPVTTAQIIIADFVFASSAFGRDGTGYIEKNIEWIRQARATGKHVFSFNSASKQFGKTGARCGYLWYPMYDSYAASIFKNFFNFISFSTVAGGSVGLADFLDLIKAFLDSPDNGKALRHDAYQSLIQRHELVEKELLNRYPNSTIISIPGSPTFFAKIKDSRIPNKKAADLFMEDWNVSVNTGETMGETNEFVRLNLSGYSSLLVEFLNRLSGQKKYTTQDVLVVSTLVCPHSKVVGKGASNTFYIARPGDCLIDADALKGPVEIILPPFIDYVMGNMLTIRKTDSSENPVIIKSENFTKYITDPNETLKVQWTQPFYQNGRWDGVHTKQ